MPASAPAPKSNPTESWAERWIYWRRKLGRIKLGVEPVEQQLERYRKVTLALSAVILVIALMFLALFSAFSRPEIGLILDAILLLPIITIAWLDHWRLTRRVNSYLRERAEFEAVKAAQLKNV